MATITQELDHRTRTDTDQAVEQSGRKVFPWGWSSLRGWLAAFVVFSAVLLPIGFLLTDVFDGSALVEAEVNASEWVERQRTDARTTAAKWGSFLSDTIPKTIAIVVLAATFVVTWRRWHDAVFLVATMVLEVSIFGFVVRTIGRARPPIEQLDGAPTDSFPSGHAAAAVAFYGALAVIAFWHTRSTWIRRLFVTLAIAAPVIVAISRFYLGMHHISDIVAGMVMGGASLIAVHRIVARGVEKVPSDEPPHTQRLEMHGS